MAVSIDLTGQRFGKLVAINIVGKRGTYIAWKCLCDCGNECIVTSSHLRSGHTKSCGCIVREHGESGTRLHEIWHGLIQRCTNKNTVNYAYYGGRGIRICDEWRNSYLNFRNWALSIGYNDSLTIDRINNDGDYSPDNCQWVDMKEQGANKRNNIYWTYNGQTKHLSEWARIVGISRMTLCQRVYRSNWSIEEALSIPTRKYKRR